MGCATVQQQLNKLQDQLQNLKEQFFSPAQKQQHDANVQSLEKEIAATQISLANCLESLLPVAPQQILQIKSADTAASIASAKAALTSLQGKIGEPSNPVTFPENVDFEWKQPLDPETEYDNTPLAATGWAVNPRAVQGDFPFSHPFDLDWESSLALDGTNAQATGPFDYLLSVGNKSPSPDPVLNDERTSDEKHASNLKLAFPLGLLGVEMDGGNIPAGFTDFIKSGSRLAVYGRWIVDCGHPFHRCEIHPPLVMAAASNPGASTTRVLFTSRPFLVGETYTKDLNNIYNDSAANDGTFYQHLTNEIENIAKASSTQVEAHPKIKSFPFQGSHQVHFLVRPPALPSPTQGARFSLEVSFNFTVRSRCSVTVSSSASDTIDVVITMNSLGYKPPNLPARSNVTISTSTLEDEDADDASKAVDDAVALAAASFAAAGGTLAELETGLGNIVSIFTGATIGAILGEVVSSRGIVTDKYASLTGAVDINSTQGAVINAAPGSIPAGGVALNDNQPFPVYGWLEANWVSLGSVSRSLS